MTNQKSLHLLSSLLLLALSLTACTASLPTDPPAAPSSTPLPGVAQTCSPSPADALGPYYTPGAPARNIVGEGYLLTGVVRSSKDCSPIPGAQIELWLAGPDGEYGDDYRATLFAAQDGSYTFESHAPPPYSGRPPHIHLRVSASGFDTLVTQHYPALGVSQSSFDLVLIPAN